MAKNVDETKEANNKEDKSPWKDLSTAIMEERWVDKVLERLQIHLQINIYFHLQINIYFLKGMTESFPPEQRRPTIFIPTHFPT